MKRSYLLLMLLAFVPSILYTSMTGGSFEIYADSFSIVDGQATTGGNFKLFSSSEGFQTASSTDGTFELRGGFQAQEKGILSYSSNSSSISLGLLNTTTVATESVELVISTDSETGYSISITEDGNLRDGANDIDDVSDGSVTAGSEEYGIVTIGGDGLLGSATAINGTVPVAAAGGQITNNITEVEFQVSIASTTASGTYSHVVTFTATVNP